MSCTCSACKIRRIHNHIRFSALGDVEILPIVAIHVPPVRQKCLRRQPCTWSTWSKVKIQTEV